MDKERLLECLNTTKQFLDKEFADLIQSEKKTVELRKISFLHNCKINEDGTILIPFEIIGKNEFLYVTFNGYQIIKKVDFNDYIEHIDEYLNESDDFDFDCDVVSKDWLYEIESDDEVKFPLWISENINWIWDNLEFINKYYQNKTEMVVLFIKDFELVKVT